MENTHILRKIGRMVLKWAVCGAIIGIAIPIIEAIASHLWKNSNIDWLGLSFVMTAPVDLLNNNLRLTVPPIYFGLLTILADGIVGTFIFTCFGMVFFSFRQLLRLTPIEQLRNMEDKKAFYRKVMNSIILWALWGGIGTVGNLLVLILFFRTWGAQNMDFALYVGVLLEYPLVEFRHAIGFSGVYDINTIWIIAAYTLTGSLLFALIRLGSILAFTAWRFLMKKSESQ